MAPPDWTASERRRHRILDTLSAWLAWAQARLAAFDPLASGSASVFEDLLKITSWTYRD